jgi:2-phosphoglycolate phosphatase
MMTAVGGVVFDLDGTLVDSRADIAAAANAALSKHGLPMRSEEQICSFVGDGAANLIWRAAGLAPESARVDAILATFLEYYAAHPCVRTTAMPGALEALEALSDLPLALLTNKSRRVTAILLSELGIAGRFRCVLAGGDLPVIKPDPAPLLEIAHRLGVAATTLVMVGDGPQDVECGRGAGAFTVGVSGGIADPNRLAASRPDRLIGSLRELNPLVRALDRSPSNRMANLPSDDRQR